MTHFFTIINREVVLHVSNDLWVKEVVNPTLKPLNSWREELYGYWMVTTDSQRVDGIEMVIARFYGTNQEEILDIWEELSSVSSRPDVGYYYNKRSNWLGGGDLRAFLVKADS